MPAPEELLQRITCDPDIMNGKPCIRGQRLTVEQLLAMLAAGNQRAHLQRVYPWLEQEDFAACLLYACQRLPNSFLS